MNRRIGLANPGVYLFRSVTAPSGRNRRPAPDAAATNAQFLGFP